MDAKMITVRLRAAWWLHAYLYVLVTLCHFTGLHPHQERLTYWIRKGLSVEPLIRRRPFPMRFVRSYIGWRKYLGIRASLAAAWRVSRT